MHRPKLPRAKVDAHIAKQVATKPQLVQISTAYVKPVEGSHVLPRNQYTAIRNEKPKTKEEAARPKFKICRFATEAGNDIGSIQKVCPNPDCPIHHPKAHTSRNDARTKNEQDKQRIETAIANTTGLRVLAAIGTAVPVRLMKGDFLFVTEGLLNLLDENRVALLAKQHGIKKNNDTESTAKAFGAVLRRANESTLGRVLVESTVLHSASRGNPSAVLKDATSFYKIDTEAIAATVKQEFAAKAKAKTAKQTTAKTSAKQPTKAVKAKAAA